MKILITNDCLASYMGTESWVYAMAKELSKEHEVTVFSRSLGKMAKKVSEFCNVTQFYKGEYDLAIVNHTTTWDLLPPELPKVFTSHSKIYDIEQPPCDNYVGVNESIGGHVIRNGIDCERFKPTHVNKELKNILLLSNPSYSRGVEFVRRAAEGYNLIILETETFEIEEKINQADLVISMARGALEAMACGKNVIYGDHRSGWMNQFKSIGMLTKDNFDEFKRGRAVDNLKAFSIEDLRNEFKKYDPDRGNWLRKQIKSYFNIEKNAYGYLSEKVLGTPKA